MLKACLQIALIITSSLFIWGCQKKSSSNTNGTSTQCLDDPYYAGCDNRLYDQYRAYGFQAYPYSGTPGYSSDPNSPFRYQLNQYYGFGFGRPSQLCSCPLGQRPVYNGGLGIGCAATQAMPNWLPIYFHGLATISGPSQNSHFVTIPQTSNINGTFSNYGGCYGDVAWSCLVGQAHQCPSGTTCQVSAQNSPIGICVRQ